MNLDEYQNKSKKYDFFEAICDPQSPFLVEKVLGLVGEAGEVADRFKKCIRDESGTIGEDAKLDLKKELGDTLWYVAAIARYLDIPLSEVAQSNLEKLEQRLQDDTLHWKRAISANR